MIDRWFESFGKWPSNYQIIFSTGALVGAVVVFVLACWFLGAAGQGLLTLFRGRPVSEPHYRQLLDRVQRLEREVEALNRAREVEHESP